MRDRFSRTTFKAILQWVDFQFDTGIVKGGVKSALGYAKNHLPRLRYYLEGGRIEIDNNQIENKIRPLALERKNYMFAGSQKGAARAAIMYSFFATCKEHEINPRDWLRDVLVRIGNHPVNRVTDLLPGQWTDHREVGM